jgi:hypothetical protein
LTQQPTAQHFLVISSAFINAAALLDALSTGATAEGAAVDDAAVNDAAVDDAAIIKRTYRPHLQRSAYMLAHG